jgi:ubiquinone/menaquinone biosynthesis C-methylase UbiE
MQQNEKNYIPALGFYWATKFYDPLVRITTREFLFKRALIQQAGLSENQTILDLGCGTGTLSIGIKKRFPSIDIHSIDIDPEVLEKAKSKASDLNYKIDFKQCYSDNLSFPDGQFDRVFSTLFFHHLSLDKKIKTLSEVRRVLKNCGEFHFADYGKPSNYSQKTLSNIIKFIDGKETTRDNLRGNLSLLFKESGFTEVQQTLSFKTVLGTIRLYICRH